MASAIAAPPGASFFKCKTPPIPGVSKRLVVVSSIPTPGRGPILEEEGSSWASSICDVVEDVVVWAFDDGVRDRKAYLLSENYAPVEEMEPVKDLPVKVHIPECMNGAFMRIGPNPRFKPDSRYHWFDGDGMIHGLNIQNGKATYVARYVKTARFQQNECYGADKFLMLGQLNGLRDLLYFGVDMLRMSLGILNASNGTGTGNTNLVYHNKRFMVLHEADKPYAMKVLEDGDLQTLGHEDYEHKLQHNFTAHPKLDITTVSKDGVIGEPVPITILACVKMHDFAITKNYAMFMDLPLRFNGAGMLHGEFPFKFDSSPESQFGVLPRYATTESQIQWFKVPTCLYLSQWKTQYVYCGVYDDRNMAIGIAKYNLDKEPFMATRELKTGRNVVGVFHHGSSHLGPL